MKGDLTQKARVFLDEAMRDACDALTFDKETIARCMAGFIEQERDIACDERDEAWARVAELEAEVSSMRYHAREGVRKWRAEWPDLRKRAEKAEAEVERLRGLIAEVAALWDSEARVVMLRSSVADGRVDRSGVFDRVVQEVRSDD